MEYKFHLPGNNQPRSTNPSPGTGTGHLSSGQTAPGQCWASKKLYKTQDAYSSLSPKSPLVSINHLHAEEEPCHGYVGEVPGQECEEESGEDAVLGADAGDQGLPGGGAPHTTDQATNWFDNTGSIALKSETDEEL